MGKQTSGTISGTSGNDIINDTFAGRRGKTGLNETIHGNAGNDTILGYNGDDVISGGLGNDSISGGNGKDTIHGNEGDDVIWGGNFDGSELDTSDNAKDILF